jgi:hypothetical protein
MLRYNTDKLDTRLYLQAIHKWIKQQWVSVEQIPEDYKRDSLSYKPYGWLKRIGLYLLTTLAIQSCVGFISFFLVQALEMDFDGKSIWFIIGASGILLFVLLNRYLKQNNVYKQGTDDAWLHAAVFYTYLGLLFLLNIDRDTHAGMLFIVISLFCLTAFTSYQYADSFVFILCVFCFNYIPLYLVSIISESLLFFSVLLVVPLNIVVIRTLNKWDVLENHYWNRCFATGRLAACLMMYLSVNLYVIRTLAFTLLRAETIPLQPVFLILTIITPLIFIGWGIKQKLKYLLYSGLFLLLPTVATVRYYYSVMPIELACMIGGLILIVISYMAIRHLQKTESAYTFEPDPEEDFSRA